jgi:hypothetical protein
MQENQTHQQNTPEGMNVNFQARQNLPNSTLILGLGILSIVFSFWYFSLLGVILSIFALVLANRDLRLYYSNTSQYTLSSFNNVKAGRVCAMIGLLVALIFFIFMILIVAGILATLPFWGMID